MVGRAFLLSKGGRLTWGGASLEYTLLMQGRDVLLERNRRFFPHRQHGIRGDASVGAGSFIPGIRGLGTG